MYRTWLGALACGLCLSALATGCSNPPIVPRDGGFDGGMDAGTDAGDDGGPDGGRDAGPRRCAVDTDCGIANLCFGGFCQRNPCLGTTPCRVGFENCIARCVPTRNPCEGVTCAADQTCVDGACFAGCLPVPCEGITCPAGDFCDPSLGGCVPIVPCNAGCGADAACHFRCPPRSACDGVTCPDGQFCRDGACLSNPCTGVMCAAGQVCSNGTCTDTCRCSPACTAPERCINNRCTCVRHCPAGVTCGTPDGCGGFCDGTCAGAQDACNPDTGTCDCVPSCPAGTTCGDDDGCGGRCMGRCTGGLACVSGTCTCTASCLAPDMIDCGAAIPATCMGSNPCTGTGTRCMGSATCVAGSCCPSCPAEGLVACGMPVPSQRDALGNACRTCTGVGSMCGTGICTQPPGTTMPDERECCGACASPSDVPCGMRIPDVLDAGGRVCRTCTGYGTGTCTSGTSCTGGAGGVCCDSCTPATSIPCGDAIPSLTCRPCSGVGSECTAVGTTCVTPPGTTSPMDRECCGNCPSSSGFACGTSVPDVMAASGTVCRDCGTGSMCPAGSTCGGGTCCPSCPPATDFPCGTMIPDQRDSTGAFCRSCGSGQMCATGSTCSSGQCCPSCASPITLACGTNPTEPAGCPVCPNGTLCLAGERCVGTSCCAPTCSPPSTRPCGDTAADGCGGTCTTGTACTVAGETCGGSPLHCGCQPSCAGRRCGESDGCGGQCRGACDPGLQCSEHTPVTTPPSYECTLSTCNPACGLCESCALGSCQPLTCAPGRTPCLFSCQCCSPGETCTATGCSVIG